MRAAIELFRERHYSVVVAVCGDALTTYPENVHIRLLRARALTALRRDEEAQRELRRCLRLDPRCPPAYRLLGELSLRRDELDSAEIFLKEAVRLDGDDPDASDLLQIARGLIEGSKKPTVMVENSRRPPSRLVLFSQRAPSRPRADKDSAAGPDSRRARAAQSKRRATAAQGKRRARSVPSTERGTVNERKPSRQTSSTERGTVSERKPSRQASEARRGLDARGHCETRRGKRMARGSSAEDAAPAIGEYLVSIGAITPSQLAIALDYQRCVGIRLGAAAVALGYISQPKLDWAAQAYHSRRRHG